ncbi:LpqB family beta-propeller domain-containing protein [Plantactinospora sp. GCM10030261]|uniref:LpqB family beta-propeller domain-containing protein n=1 Tax=Plantactinospora sp. GCM10030261 TaxID=3273420 RepID=UPI0036128270
MTTGLLGCGIPDSTDVRVAGPPRAGTSLSGAADQLGTQDPPARTETLDPATFVMNYLSAAAGETDGAYGRVHEFLPKDTRTLLPPKGASEVTLTVVRVEETDFDLAPAGSVTRVTVPYEVVGVLQSDGTIGPPPATPSGQYTFEVGRAQPDARGKVEPGLWLHNPPRELMLSTKALAKHYVPYAVYFWSSDNSHLVPDLRHLPRKVPRERHATEIAGWLNDGPSEWLRSVARSLPDGIRVTGNVAETDAGRLEVNLSLPNAGADEEAELDRLVTQLAWSMPDDQNLIDVKVGNESRRSFDAVSEREIMPLYDVSERNQRFVVYDGQVRAVASGVSDPPPFPPPLTVDTNQNVLSAGIVSSGDTVAAGLVVSAGDRQALAAGIGSGSVAVKRLGGRSYGAMGRPVWLKVPYAKQRMTGLVVADGKLFRFDVEAGMVEVRIPNVSGPLASVGAALDGRRIAVVAGGRVYVAAVNTDGAGLTAGEARPVPVPLTAPTAVDWFDETSLAVAGTGRGGRPMIYQVTVDGGADFDLHTPDAPVTQLATYPNNPVVGKSSTWLMYEAAGSVWANRFNSYEQVTAQQVVGAEAGQNGPRAPFFLY